MLTASTLKPEETRLDQCVRGVPSMGIGRPTPSDKGPSRRPLTFTRAHGARPSPKNVARERCGRHHAPNRDPLGKDRVKAGFY